MHSHNLLHLNKTFFVPIFGPQYFWAEINLHSCDVGLRSKKKYNKCHSRTAIISVKGVQK